MNILDTFSVQVVSVAQDEEALTVQTVALAAALDEFIARLSDAGLLVAVTDEVATVLG